MCAIATKDNASTTLNYNYVYTDHLGSIVKLTNNTGTTIAEQNFDAWGRLCDPNNWSSYTVPTTYAAILGTNGGTGWLTRGYTGHEHLPQVDLINMNGRLYDAVVGRMLSPDRYVQDATNSQSYNRYTYALNNPLKYTDPSGWLNAAYAGETVEADDNSGGGGGSGYIGGDWANLTGGVSNYNYLGSYSVYASNPALYGAIYGTQTWMQKTTGDFEEKQRREREAWQRINDPNNYTKSQKEVGYIIRDNDATAHYSFVRNLITEYVLNKVDELINNSASLDFGLTAGGTMNDMFSLAGEYALYTTRAVGSELATTSKFIKGSAGVGTMITLAGAGNEIVSNKFDTHTLVDLGVGATLLGVGFIFASPAVVVGLAGAGLVYGMASFMGGSDWIDNATNHWGYEKMYGQPLKKKP